MRSLLWGCSVEWCYWEWAELKKSDQAAYLTSKMEAALKQEVVVARHGAVQLQLLDALDLLSHLIPLAVITFLILYISKHQLKPDTRLKRVEPRIYPSNSLCLQAYDH